MTSVRFAAILDRLQNDLERTGAVVWAHRAAQRPASVRVESAHATTDCLLYLWTVTPGGKGRSEDEWRIQVTGIQAIQFKPGAATLFGGWCPDFGVYAFWDATRHRGFRPGSPSFQVHEATLQAAAGGFATEVREVDEGSEVVVAVAPDALLWYVHNGRRLHGLGPEATALPKMLEASPSAYRRYVGDAPDEDQRQRRNDLVITSRRYRDQRFTVRVLEAYGNRCAVCGAQLRLVDAAHIVPVSEPGSTDRMSNGIALCRLHHGAYDTCLIGLFPDLRVVLNEERSQHLQDAGLEGGLQDFRARLPNHISVPSAEHAKPSPDNLQRGLEVRGWPSHLTK